MPKLLTLDDLDPTWRQTGRWRLGAGPGQPGAMALPVDTVHLHHTVTADTGDVIADACKVCDIDQGRFGKLSYSWMAHESSYSWIEVEGNHRGAHTINNANQSLNGVSFGVAAIGNFQPTANIPPPRPASDRLVHLLAEGIVEHVVTPGGLVVAGFRIDAHRDVYATACDGQSLYERTQEIRDLVAAPPPAPEVDMNAPTVVEYQGHRRAYCRGIDGQLYEKIDDAKNWTPLGGVLHSGPDVCVDVLGNLHVFYRSSTDSLFHLFFVNGAWSGGEDLGGILTSAPNCYASVDANGARRIDIVVRGNDSGVYIKTFADEKWSDWGNLGGLT